MFAFFEMLNIRANSGVGFVSVPAVWWSLPVVVHACGPQVTRPWLGIDSKEKAKIFWPSAMENAILDTAVPSKSGRIAQMNVANFQQEHR